MPSTGSVRPTPLSVGFYRLLLSAPVLLVLSRVYAGPSFWRVRPQDRGTLALMGAAFAAYQVCYFAAIPYIGVAAAVLINICSAPVMVARGLAWQYTPVGWGLLLYLGLVPTALGYGFYLRGLRTTTATVSAVVALLEPLISTVLAVTLLGEQLSRNGVLGGALLLASVVFLYVRQKSK